MICRKMLPIFAWMKIDYLLHIDSARKHCKQCVGVNGSKGSTKKLP